MKLDEALQIVSNILSAYRGTLPEHQQIQQALQVVTRATQPKVKAKDASPDSK